MNRESPERRGRAIDHQSCSPRRITAASQVLYTDLDHSLHRTNAYRTKDGIVPGSSSTPFFEFADLLERILAPYRDVAIVLSTSWVQELGFEETRSRFPIASLRARIVDSTYHPEDGPVSEWSKIPRGAQVLRHVRRYGLNRWLAIDDDRRGVNGYESRLIHCQHGVGLGDQDVQKLLARRLEQMFALQSSSCAGISQSTPPT
ncbi:MULTISPECIES: HAD domain-containing protein [unclassified Paraburkholderia]|uniref:HAD domain-containing protein n=1 Tax=unclassified Paraburkholderia TaxID=2615204 RepID=UPI0038BD45ED